MCLHDFLVAHASHLLIHRGIDICIAGENVVHHIVFHGLLEQQPPDAITEHLQMVRRYTHVTKITQRMVSELIDHIDVYHAEKRDGVTNQRIVIHYNCIGAFEVPDRKKIPETDIIMETRKGVALSYAPEQVAV